MTSMDPAVLEKTILSSVLNAVIFVNKVHVFGCICITVDGCESESVTLKLNKLMGQVDKPLPREKHIEASLNKLRSRFRKRSNSFDSRCVTTDENENIQSDLSAFHRSQSSGRATDSPKQNIRGDKKSEDMTKNRVNLLSGAGGDAVHSRTGGVTAPGNLEGGVVDPKQRLVLEKALKEFLRLKYQQKLNSKTQSPTNDASLMPNTSPIPPEFLKLVSLQARIMGVPLSDDYTQANNKPSISEAERPTRTIKDKSTNSGNWSKLFRDINAKTPQGVSELVLKKNSNSNNISMIDNVSNATASPRQAFDSPNVTPGFGITKQKRLSFTGNSENYWEQQASFTEAIHKKLDVINSTANLPEHDPPVVKRKSLFRTGSSDKRKEFVKQMLDKCSTKQPNTVVNNSVHVAEVDKNAKLVKILPTQVTNARAPETQKLTVPVKLDIFKDLLGVSHNSEARTGDAPNMYTFKPIESSPTDHLVDSCALRNSETFPSQEPCTVSEISTQPVTESNQQVRDSDQPLTESMVTKATQPVVKATQPMTQSTQSVPKSTHPVQKSIEIAPKSTQPVKKSNESAQKSTHPVQKSNDPASKCPRSVTDKIKTQSKNLVVSILKDTTVKATEDYGSQEPLLNPSKNVSLVAETSFQQPRVESGKGDSNFHAQNPTQKDVADRKRKTKSGNSLENKKLEILRNESHPFLPQDSLGSLTQDSDTEQDIEQIADDFKLPFSDIDCIPDMPVARKRSKCKHSPGYLRSVEGCVVDSGAFQGTVMTTNEDSNSSFASVGSVGFEINSVDTPRKCNARISGPRADVANESRKHNPVEINKTQNKRARQRKSKPKKYSPRKDGRKSRGNGQKPVNFDHEVETFVSRNDGGEGKNSDSKVTLKRSNICDFEREKQKRFKFMTDDASSESKSSPVSVRRVVENFERIVEKTDATVCNKVKNVKPVAVDMSFVEQRGTITPSRAAETKTRPQKPEVTCLKIDESESLKRSRCLQEDLNSANTDAHVKRLKHDISVVKKIRPRPHCDVINNDLSKTHRFGECKQRIAKSASTEDTIAHVDNFSLQATNHQNSINSNKLVVNDTKEVRKSAYKALPLIASSVISLVPTMTNKMPLERAKGERYNLQKGNCITDSSDNQANGSGTPGCSGAFKCGIGAKSNIKNESNGAANNANIATSCDRKHLKIKPHPDSFKVNTENTAKASCIGVSPSTSTNTSAPSTASSINTHNSTKPECRTFTSTKTFSTSPYGHLLVRPVPTIYSSPSLSKNKAYPKASSVKTIKNSENKNSNFGMISDFPKANSSLESSELRNSTCDKNIRPTSGVHNKSDSSLQTTYPGIEEKVVAENSCDRPRVSGEVKFVKDSKVAVFRMAINNNIALERQNDDIQTSENAKIHNTIGKEEAICGDKRQSSSVAGGNVQNLDKENDTFVKFVATPTKRSAKDSPSKSRIRRSGSSKRKPRARKSSNKGSTEMWVVPKLHQRSPTSGEGMDKNEGAGSAGFKLKKYWSDLYGPGSPMAQLSPNVLEK